MAVYKERYEDKNGIYKPTTPVRDLFVTGQDLVTGGISSAMTGGILTAHAILGYDMVDYIVLGRTLIKDLMNVTKKAKTN